MQLLIPIENIKRSRKRIAEGFSVAETGCLYNIETSEYEWIKLSDLKAYSGNVINEFKKRDIRFIIASEMKPMALGLFVDNEITVFQAEGNDLEKNIQLFNENRLLFLNPYIALLKASCSSTCASCTSTCKN